MRGIVVVSALGAALGCAGLAPVEGAEREVLFFRKAEGGCEWIRWSAASGEQRVQDVHACPAALRLSPARDRVVGLTEEDEVFVASWPSLAGWRAQRLPVPAFHNAVRLDVLGGEIHARLLVRAEELPRGERLLMRAGSLEREVDRPAAGSEDQARLMAHYRAPLEGGDWTLVRAEASLVYGGAELPWPALPEGSAWPEAPQAVDAAGLQSSVPREWKDRADLASLFGPEDGLWPALSVTSSGGWLLGGHQDPVDGPFVRPPIYDCRDPACLERVELQLPQKIYRLAPQGDYLLAVGESSGVYQRGRAEPLFVLSGKARGGWLP